MQTERNSGLSASCVSVRCAIDAGSLLTCARTTENVHTCAARAAMRSVPRTRYVYTCAFTLVCGRTCVRSVGRLLYSRLAFYVTNGCILVRLIRMSIFLHIDDEDIDVFLGTDSFVLIRNKFFWISTLTRLGIGGYSVRHLYNFFGLIQIILTFVWKAT